MTMISVIVTTTGRSLLARAVTSIERQDYTGPIEIILVPLTRNRSLPHAVKTVVRECRLPCRCHPLVLEADVLAAAPQLAFFPPARIGRQRNLGLANSSGTYIAHLDDDNEWQPDHLSSLAELLDQDATLAAAHSWRRLLWPDGESYLLDLYPWVKKPWVSYARGAYNALVDQGVFKRKSCEIRDQLATVERGALLTVDTSEWLIRRNVQLAVPFREDYTFREISHALSHDYLFCKDLFDLGTRVGCTERFTLNYYLGGRSTRWILQHRMTSTF